ncbi:RNA-binding S4 domain-containing protein [Oryzifoliimicrobium ureilyticus]|uniref:RNA-binding S4 domain-containing protein n=1 Tax=Oryzifoliimicrobium ureilyticus TaxID=3113724 RepID=UPI0030762B67
MSDEKQSSASLRQRIDKWLFFSRMIKSRSLAQAHIEQGRVRINGERVAQPSHTVRVGDKVEVAFDRRDVTLFVLAPGTRRGPYEEAKLLYEDLTPAETEKLTPYEQAIRSAGSGRPTKKERRAIQKLMSKED